MDQQYYYCSTNYLTMKEIFAMACCDWLEFPILVSAPASWAQNEDASVASSSEILFVSAGVPTGASDGDVPPQLCG